MKTLSETSREDAFSDAAATAASLDFATRFTQRFQQLTDVHPAQREAAMLTVQFPAILCPIEPDDYFAGRIRYGLVGLSPEPCGLGYYCAFDAINTWLKSNRGTKAQRSQAQALIRFWKGRTTTEKVRAAYSSDLTSILPSDAWTQDSGVAFPLYRMAGTVLDFATLLRLGLDGLSVHLEAEPANRSSSFRQAGIKAIAVLRSSIDFYLSTCTDNTVSETLSAIRHRPPESLREAIQLFWLYAIHAGTWNYGRLDSLLGPYLVRDLSAGVLTRDEALNGICSLWQLMHAYDNQYNNRVIIGGRGRTREFEADQFALLAIEATRSLKLNQPQLSLRLYDGQNPLLWEQALDAIGEGCTFPILYNDDANVPAVAQAFQIDETAAEQYTPFGCGEYTIGHLGENSPNGVINLLKALEVALHEGRDPLTKQKLATVAPLEEIRSFEALWDTYSRIVDRHVAALARHQRLEYAVADRDLPFLYISLLTADCVDRDLGAFGGGARLLGGTIETYGNVNTADSLQVINELVFRRKEVGLAELVAAMDANFEGHEDLKQLIVSIPKYGNDDAEADHMMARVHQQVCASARKQAAEAGLDSYLVVIINNWANTILGRKTLASADGRLSGTPMANGNNPAPGNDISGITAFLNSLAKLNPDIHAGAVQNMKFSRDWFRSNRRKFSALLQTYFKRGGTQAMITVLSQDDLRDAMVHPEKYANLIVRVGGFSIRFIDLPKEAQREVLARTIY